METTKFPSSLARLIGATSLGLVLYGCSASGNDSTPVDPAPAPIPSLAVTNLQGIWSGSLGSDSASAVVLSDGRVWVIANSTPLKFYAATFSGTTSNYIASGKQYSGSATLGSVDVAFSATAAAKGTLNGTLTPSGGLPTAYNFAYQSRYETPAALADIAGTWRGTQAASTLAVEWIISANGVLTQGPNNSNGCAYTGSVNVHSVPVPVGIFDLKLRESCTALSVTSTKEFAGIVTLNTAKTGATFAFTRSEPGQEGVEGLVQPVVRQ